MTPERIQLRRTKGWRKPANTVVVARPGKWGNHIVVGEDVETAEEAVELFQGICVGNPGFLAMVKKELRGKNLACWCAPGQPCHADVLLRWANE